MLEHPPPLVLIGRCYIDELASRPGVHVLGACAARAGDRGAAALALQRRPLALAGALRHRRPRGAAAGKPIVATATGGLRDIVIDGETGLLVPPEDREALAAALQKLTADAGLREQLGAGAKQQAAKFSPAAIVPQFEQAYQLALETHSARAA